MSLQSLNCLRMEQLLLERAKQEERIAESIRTLTPKSTIEDLLALKELSAERQKTLNNIEETDKRLEVSSSSTGCYLPLTNWCSR